LRINSQEIEKIAFHDPCYLGRQNNILAQPRQILQRADADLIELIRHEKKSFCCGAGGAQMWKEEEEGRERVSSNRFREAQESGAETLAVGCPFCLIMLDDAAGAENGDLELLDIAEIVAARLE
jgi:Fe-S oxidoreductase